MIINCVNCNKKFDVNADLIPNNGRLLECSGCNHKWFFKKEKINKPVPITDEVLSIKETNIPKIKIAPKSTVSIGNKQFEKKDKLNQELKEDSSSKNDNKMNKNFGLFNLIIVFFISFVALIIIIDTFKSPIGKIVPNIEFILYSLYESIKDIELFFKDLT